MLRALEAMSKHWEITTAILVSLILLSIISGATLSSLWSHTAKSVCFSHHSPAECDPSLRVRSTEETIRLNELYLRCLQEHPGYQMRCMPLYDH